MQEEKIYAEEGKGKTRSKGCKKRFKALWVPKVEGKERQEMGAKALKTALMKTQEGFFLTFPQTYSLLGYPCPLKHNI